MRKNRTRMLVVLASILTIILGIYISILSIDTVNDKNSVQTNNSSELTQSIKQSSNKINVVNNSNPGLKAKHYVEIKNNDIPNLKLLEEYQDTVVNGQSNPENINDTLDISWDIIREGNMNVLHVSNAYTYQNNFDSSSLESFKRYGWFEDRLSIDKVVIDQEISFGSCVGLFSCIDQKSDEGKVQLMNIKEFVGLDNINLDKADEYGNKIFNGDASYMFAGCDWASTTTLPRGLYNVKNAYGMFTYTSVSDPNKGFSEEILNQAAWRLSSAINLTHTFSNNLKINNFGGMKTIFNENNLPNIQYMFYNDKNLHNININNWHVFDSFLASGWLDQAGTSEGDNHITYYCKNIGITNAITATFTEETSVKWSKNLTAEMDFCSAEIIDEYATSSSPASLEIYNHYDALNLSYKVNNGSWTDFKNSNWKVSNLIYGDKVFIKGDNPSGFSQNKPERKNHTTINVDKKFSISGDIVSLVYANTANSDIIKTVPGEGYCFANLFDSIDSQANPNLVSITDDFLSFTNLKPHCYDSMFKNCNSIEISPYLPASIELQGENSIGCYESMFDQCNNLYEVNVGFKNFPINEKNEYTSTENWLQRTAYYGYVNVPSGFNFSTDKHKPSDSAIPNHWTINKSSDPNYCTLICTNDSANHSITINKNENDKLLNLYYKIDDGEWIKFSDENNWKIQNLGINQRIYLKGDNYYDDDSHHAGFSTNNYINTIKLEGSFNVSGEATSLIYGDRTDDRITKTIPGNKNCFANLFEYNKESLLAVDNNFLPFIYLKPYCYDSMFLHCDKLTNSPNLPAAMNNIGNLSNNCYMAMFLGCTSLKKAPDLLAPDFCLAKDCYKQMFSYCSNLNSLSVGFKKFPKNDKGMYTSTENWLLNIGNNGTFQEPENADYDPSDYNNFSGVPWQRPLPDCCTINILEDHATLTIYKGEDDNKLNLLYKINNSKWEDFSQHEWKVPNLKKGDKVYLKGDNYYNDDSHHAGFSASSGSQINSIGVDKLFSVSGEATSLVYGDNLSPDKISEIPGDNHCFEELFSYDKTTPSCQDDSTNLVSVSSNFLPFTKLKANCYKYMFYKCRHLTIPDDFNLPAAVNGIGNLANSCYSFMFMSCSSITKGPDLLAPIDKLEVSSIRNCYGNMFSHCSSLYLIKVGFMSFPRDPDGAYTSTSFWMNLVNDTGSIIKLDGSNLLNEDVVNESSVPWHQTCTINIEDDDATLQINRTSSNSKLNLMYKINNYPWHDFNENNWTIPGLKKGDRVYLKGDNYKNDETHQAGFSTKNITNRILVNKPYSVSGEATSLVYGDITDRNITNHIPGDDSCFHYLFENNNTENVYLTSVSENFLPFTYLAPNCYSDMFCLCVNLKVPEDFKLPAAVDEGNLAPGCYYRMFMYCKLLVKAPDLQAPLEKLNYENICACYSQMFAWCDNLKIMKVGFREFPRNKETGGYWCTNEWTKGLGENVIILDTFDCPKDNHYKLEDYNNPSGIAMTNYCSINIEDSTANSHNSAQLKILREGTCTDTKLDLYYKVNRGEWTKFSDANHWQVDNLNNGDKVYLKGSNYIDDETHHAGFSTINSKNMISVNKKFSVTGQASSLLYDEIYDRSKTTTIPGESHCFYSLFSNESAQNLIFIDHNFLPFTTLKKNCYYSMFKDCTNLTYIPDKLLPARTLVEGCYLEMFYNCAALTSLPQNLLPAQTLANHCYEKMFSECINLKIFNKEQSESSYVVFKCPSLSKLDHATTEMFHKVNSGKCIETPTEETIYYCE